MNEQLKNRTEPLGDWVPGENPTETIQRRTARLVEIDQVIADLEAEKAHLLRCMTAVPEWSK